MYILKSQIHYTYKIDIQYSFLIFFNPLSRDNIRKFLRLFPLFKKSDFYFHELN